MSIINSIIGVDVGGTNTDAVIVQRQDVVGFSKQPTTPDVTSGVIRAIYTALKAVKVGPLNIQQINIGTTHFVNAVVQRSAELSKVAVLRLAKRPFTEAAPPFSDFPKSLRNIVYGGYELLSGGYQFDGQEIAEIDSKEVVQCVSHFKSQGIRNFVVCGTFSPVKNDQENEVGKILDESFGDEISYTLSHELGQLGILERENAAILNESLKVLCKKVLSGLISALEQHINLKCPVFLAQNDGTICNVSQALQYPIFTFASGPTNSMRGAAFISGVKNAVVVDIGGTTTDVGVLVDGFPRQASSTVEIGGVPTNFRMPNTLSIGLGGGSHVEGEYEHLTVGPTSVGYRITEDALCFGGNVLTATDSAAFAGMVPGIDRNAFNLHSKMGAPFVSQVLHKIRVMVETAIDRMKTSAEEMDVVLVGGGSVLIDASETLTGCARTLCVEHFSVANAIGAALCQVSGHVDYVASLESGDVNARLKAIEWVKHEAVQLAINNGAAKDGIELAEFEELPLSYLPGNAIRFKAKAIGDLDLAGMSTVTLNPKQLPDLNIPQIYSEIPTSAQSPTSTVVDAVYGAPSDVTCENGQPWKLNAADIECLAVGAGILGCGGGGSPHLGKTRLLRQIEEGKTPTVVSLDWLLQQKNSFGKFVIPTGFIGAPVAQYERPSSGNETITAIQLLCRFLADKTYADSLKREKTSDGVVEFGHIENLPPDLTDKKYLEQICCAIMPFEIGGLNSTEPLSVATELQLPCLDVDCMGRAFPELQMFTTAMYGYPVFPNVQASDTGRNSIVFWGKTPKNIEDFERGVCISNGCSGGSAINPVAVEKIKDFCILGSISRAWRLGKAVLQAKRFKQSPVDAILECEGGKVICVGKITEVQRKVEGGFNKGHVIVQTTSQRFNIDFQNENTVVWQLAQNEPAQPIVCVPDLICILNEEDGTPITTEQLRYGLRVVVLGLPADKMLKTEVALKSVGPQAFGYPEVTFKPL